MINECAIYDFETLAQTPNAVVTSMALLSFSESRYLEDPYTFDELVSLSSYIKFDVSEQVKTYKRYVDQDTVMWWSKQSKEARKQILPSDKDVSIDALYDFLLKKGNCSDNKKVYTRGLNFDSVIMDSVLLACGKTTPFHWGNMRDTKSMIDGLAFGSGLKNTFVPPTITTFEQHNPQHDVAMDVMRMQFLVRSMYGDASGVSNANV